MIALGAGLGIMIAVCVRWVLRNVVFEIDSMYPIFMTAIAILGYSLSEWAGGSGFLCVYIIGIILGNSRILRKKSMVHFFDGISWLMQILLFFTLGLLSFPSRIPSVLGLGISVSLILFLVARPLAVALILTPFRTPLRQQLLVAGAGLRGAASLVCAIYAVTYGAVVGSDLFHIVFIVALFSVLVQGTMLPYVARALDLVEANDSVLRTFTDYEGEIHNTVVEKKLAAGDPWAGKALMDADVPPEMLVMMIRRGREVIIPHGTDVLMPDDTLVMITDTVMSEGRS